jgi:alpha-tubulin suppressor-like RCC1 family protein
MAPTELPIHDVTAIGVGVSFSCALRATKTVQCWGMNTDSQLGHDPATDLVDGEPYSITPTDVGGLSDVVGLSVGSYHVCVVTSSDTVKCWGAGNRGANGNPSFASTHVPTLITFAVPADE